MTDRRSWLLSAATLSVAAGLPRIVTAQGSPVVRFATSPAEGYLQPWFAQDAGIFTKAGLNCEVTLLGTGAAVSTAVASGAIDVGVSTVTNIANAIVRGIPFVMIAPSVLTTTKVPSGLVVVAKSSSIRNAKDLEGKTVAVPALKQIVDLALRVWLTQGGADPDKVQVVESSFADMGPGVVRGTFGAAVISEPSLTNALKHDDVRSIGNPYGTLGPSYTIAGWITTTGYRQKYPEVVRKVTAALLESARWANTHHEQTAAIVSRITKIDIETIRNENRPPFAEDIRPQDLQPQLDAAFKFGFLSRAVSASELFGKA
jgi:NitT/TauT family transport system substrate-binding protein